MSAGAEPAQGTGASAEPGHGIGAGEEWSRAGWRAHLPGIGDPPAYVGRLGEATIPELAAASAAHYA